MAVTGSVTAQPRPVLAEVALPRAVWVDVALVVGAAALTAVAAQVSFPVPGSPVPVTGQTFAVLLSGAALGATRGVAGMLLYLLAGTAGVPVFADGSSGTSVMFGATGGYLVGFLLAVALMGAVARRGLDRRPVSVAVAFVLGSLVIYGVGVPWLAVSADQSLGWAVENGAVPFLLGDAGKAALAGLLLPGSWAAVRRLQRR